MFLHLLYHFPFFSSQYRFPPPSILSHHLLIRLTLVIAFITPFLSFFCYISTTFSFSSLSTSLVFFLLLHPRFHHLAHPPVLSLFLALPTLTVLLLHHFNFLPSPPSSFSPSRPSSGSLPLPQFTYSSPPPPLPPPLPHPLLHI